ncbi:hypothetical protein BD779DRAFT_704109 [Infundibulicybe gibba]|nr:hypothetical protein BD779DRAFT_704109 [Infundibulicybe gibba]
MAPSVADPALYPDEHRDHPTIDSRPLKRARKTGGKPRETEEHQFASTAPLDHIFIADGVAANKKPGGKKTPLSCCECRRLKLKCDRSFPCASCKKRGCAEICPDGVLVSGKGTRFILANTEQLHSKIQEMSDRIRNLEEGLAALHSTSTQDPATDPHPLLHPDLLGIKSTMGLYGGTQVGSETPAPLSDTAHESEKPPHMDVDPPDRDSSEETCKVSVQSVTS